jgi:hypothetical protein
MVEEHPLMVDDLEQLRNAEISHEPILDRRAPPPPAWTSLVSALFGFVALAIGILCIGMILWAVAFC